MRLLANENLPRQAVELLRQHGHDVACVRDQGPGLRDDDVLQRAQAEGRVLITMDKDFAALAFRHSLPADSGVVLLRVSATDPQRLARLVAGAMTRPRPWAGHLVTIEPDRVRIRALPRHQRPGTD